MFVAVRGTLEVTMVPLSKVTSIGLPSPLFPVPRFAESTGSEDFCAAGECGAAPLSLVDAEELFPDESPFADPAAFAASELPLPAVELGGAATSSRGRLTITSGVLLAEVNALRNATLSKM